jgi:DNA-binding NtrC family response regulator
LLVEDEDTVREPARRMLVRSGYRVLAASNAEDALRLAASHGGPVDLLLTDVVMSGRSGKDLAVELHRARPKTKVLYMSGYSRDLIVHQGVLDQGVTLIQKPFGANQLRQQIRDVIDGP